MSRPWLSHRLFVHGSTASDWCERERRRGKQQPREKRTLCHVDGKETSRGIGTWSAINNDADEFNSGSVDCEKTYSFNKSTAYWEVGLASSRGILQKHALPATNQCTWFCAFCLYLPTDSSFSPWDKLESNNDTAALHCWIIVNHALLRVRDRRTQRKYLKEWHKTSLSSSADYIKNPFSITIWNAWQISESLAATQGIAGLEKKDNHRHRSESKQKEGDRDKSWIYSKMVTNSLHRIISRRQCSSSCSFRFSQGTIIYTEATACSFVCCLVLRIFLMKYSPARYDERTRGPLAT